MSKAEYCIDCNRIKGVGCTCGMSFQDKIQTQNLNWATWSATR